MTLNPSRCLAASISLHGVLVAVLLLAPAFSRKPPEMIEVQTLEWIPAQILEQEFNHLSGGGGASASAHRESAPPRSEPAKPSVKPALDPAPPKPQVKVTSTPTKVDPPLAAKPPDKTVEKIRLAESPIGKQTPSKPLPEDPAGDPQPKAAKPVKREIQVSANKVTVSAAELESVRREKQEREQEQERAAADDAQRAEIQRERQLRELSENRRKATERMMGRLAKGLSSGVSIGLPSGGESYAGYASVLGQLYKSAWSRFKPSTTGREVLFVRAEVKIARDGTILSARIVTPSGVSEVDRSVDRALREVGRAPEFPKTNRDAERMFPITFQLDGNSGA